MKFHSLIFLVFALAIASCNTKKDTITYTNAIDYNTYFEADQNKTLKEAENQRDFWSKRLDKDTTGIGDIAPLAAAYTRMFEANGNISNLKNAETLYKKAIAIAAPSLRDNHIRSLSHNYISQHRFKEATKLLVNLYAGPSNKHLTELQLFDSYMEIGAYKKAKQILKNLKNESDYHYLIRVAKWSDHNGDLDAAIRYLERARTIAESRNNRALKIWTYSNIADFYGHDGNIKASYEHYLKTLELQPDNTYAKKGIAWIIYSKERNTTEANRIIDSLIVYHDIPDYYLLKSEFAQFDGKEEAAKKYLKMFINKAQNPAYGAMYKAYLIETLVNTHPSEALKIAQTEILNRATPQTYHLLALAQLKNGKPKEALQTIEEKVLGQTHEPKAIYHSAMVYKANGLSEKVAALKKELLGAIYELGPVIGEKIEEL